MTTNNAGKRWSRQDLEFVETPQRVVAFLDAYEALCRQHGLTLSTDGGYCVEDYDDDEITEVRNASLNIDTDQS